MPTFRMDGTWVEIRFIESLWEIDGSSDVGHVNSFHGIGIVIIPALVGLPAGN